MDLDAFQNTITRTQGPLIVEFWAPWCAPCRMMAPALDRLTDQFSGRVTVLKVNADESSEVLRNLRVMAIPTMIIYSDGQEVQRLVGAQSPQALNGLFERLASGTFEPSTLVKVGMDPVTRMIRLVSGFLILLLGIWTSQPVVSVGGALVMFWGWYDRCPVWNALFPRVKAALRNLQRL